VKRFREPLPLEELSFVVRNLVTPEIKVDDGTRSELRRQGRRDRLQRAFGGRGAKKLARLAASFGDRFRGEKDA
jgi:hypothetical protein